MTAVTESQYFPISKKIGDQVFILGFFGNKIKSAQARYHNLTSALVNQKYKSPLEEVISSTLLGGPNFISFVTDNFLSNKTNDKNLPALKELHKKPSMQKIFELLDSAFKGKPRLGRSAKLYLSQQYTSLKLADIGREFGIRESGVSQAGKRITSISNSDKSFKSKISKLEKKLIS